MTTPTTPDLTAIAERCVSRIANTPYLGNTDPTWKQIVLQALTEAVAPLQARIAFLERNVTPVNYIQAYHDVCKDREDILNGKPEWVQKLRAELTTLRADKRRLTDGLQDLFEMMDEGIIVRDTSRDAEESYAERMIKFVTRLKVAHSALDSAIQNEKGHERNE